MPKLPVKTPRVPPSTGHYSQAIATEARGRMVFVSGMTARKPDGTVAGIGDVEAQTRQVCENIRNALEAAGARMDDVCRIDVYLRSIGDRERFNKVRQEYWPANPPASTLVEVSKLVSPEYLVEITAFAVTSG
jgi:2-iminobutanoate/2-iminopropanoate deaminase